MGLIVVVRWRDRGKGERKKKKKNRRLVRGGCEANVDNDDEGRIKRSIDQRRDQQGYGGLYLSSLVHQRVGPHVTWVGVRVLEDKESRGSSRGKTTHSGRSEHASERARFFSHFLIPSIQVRPTHEDELANPALSRIKGKRREGEPYLR